MDYKEKFNCYLVQFESYLKKVLDSLDANAPRTITEAMRYAIEGGGKRVRPILCVATAEILGISFEQIKELALSIELIHAYSLVHDDLPAMDNDDYRRGKLSTHKKFGEANGILAGDALLTFAFENCLANESLSINQVKALKIIAELSGYRGMIAGQVLDIENQFNDNPTEELLYSIIENKTSKLITAPLLVASVVANNMFYDELKDVGYHIGALFQIVDDIMDEEGTLDNIGKTPHKDKKLDKLTAVKVFGIDGARERAKLHYDQCVSIINKLPNNEFLLTFVDNLYKRNK